MQSIVKISSIKCHSFCSGRPKVFCVEWCMDR